MELGKHEIRIACGYQVVKCFAGNGGNWGLSGDSGDWKLENGNLKPKSRKIGARGDPNRRRGKRLPPTREAQEKSEVKSPTRKTEGHPNSFQDLSSGPPVQAVFCHGDVASFLPGDGEDMVMSSR